MNTYPQQDLDRVFDVCVGLGLRELDGVESVPDVSRVVLQRLEARAAAPARSPQRWFAILAALLAVAVVTTLLVRRQTGGGPGDASVVAPDPAAQDPAAQDPVGPWLLVYEVPPDELRRAAADVDANVREQLLDRTVLALQRRVGALAVVARGEATTVRITTAGAAAGDVAAVRAWIEHPGRLAMRLVADGDYVAGEVRFDLARERGLLQEWLDRGGRERLLQDPRAIAEHRAASEHLRWFVRRVLPQDERSGSWGERFVDVPQLAASTVAAHTDADWNGGTMPLRMRERPAGQRFLLELVAINLHERHFREQDVDPDSVALRIDGASTIAVAYRLRDAAAAEYADFREKFLGKHCAILWSDEVVAAPRFEGRIPGVEHIAGLPGDQARAMAKLLATPLPVPLQFVSQRSERQAPR